MKTLMALLAVSLGGCVGFCSASPGEAEASLYVSDAATGARVRQPSFTENGADVAADCQEPDASDSWLCASWLLVGEPGHHTFTVGARGYRSTTVTVDTSETDSIHLAVELVKL
jgi:hypothetical protein